jgi:GNAT superfamily N-acetyltransferase
MRMLQNKRIIVSLYLCTALLLSECAENNETHSERTLTMNENQNENSSPWLTECRNLVPSKGIFLAQDDNGNTIELEWEKIDGKLPRLNEKIRSLRSILSEIYTDGEIRFARTFPDLVPQEYFLKTLTPFFENGAEKVDWQHAEKQLNAFSERFFATTDFTQFSGDNDVYIFVVAKDKNTQKNLGLIQYMITSDYAEGEIRVAYFGVLPEAQNRAIEKLLMCTIFKLIPKVKRIFMHTRCTNEAAINLYCSWGFTKFPGELVHWTDLEYFFNRSDMLQRASEHIRKN